MSQRNRGRQRYKKELGKRRQRKYGKRTLQPQRRERKGEKEVNALFDPGEGKGEHSNDEESFAAYPPFFLENPTYYKKATKERGKFVLPKCQTRAVPF